MCRSTIRCIPPTSVCDRIFHCEDGSDEAPQMCSKLSGNFGIFIILNILICLSFQNILN